MWLLVTPPLALEAQVPELTVTARRARRRRTDHGARRKLDDMILPLFDARRKGRPLTQEAIVDAIVKELGAPGRQFFESVILRGETLIPASGAFGPCFERRPTKYSSGGNDFDGYEWVRVASVPDARCRDW